MTDRPFIFTGESVRAILAGTKTQTRRLCTKARDESGAWAASVHPDGAGTGWIAWWPRPISAEQTRKCYPGDDGFPCPHGAVGDRIWVRETWARIYDVYPFGESDPSHIEYRADGDEGRFPGDWPSETRDDAERPRWKSPWFLRRADSRIDLEITDVRVQRLHSISPTDIEAEGVLVNCEGTRGARSYLVEEWDTINGKRAPWLSNPWVFALTFRRIKPALDATRKAG
jgi:hypothetical protein